MESTQKLVVVEARFKKVRYEFSRLYNKRLGFIVLYYHCVCHSLRWTLKITIKVAEYIKRLKERERNIFRLIEVNSMSFDNTVVNLNI